MSAAARKSVKSKHVPEPRFSLVIQGFAYIFERREDRDDGTPVYYLVDAEKDDGMGSASK